MISKKTIVVLLTLMVLVGGLFAKTKKLNIGIVYIGPARDGGWSQAHDDGIEEAKKLKSVKRVIKKENVPESSEATKVITQMVEVGKADIVFTTSFGYMDQTLEVAANYPDKVFMHCSGYKRSDNVGTYFGKMYQAKYLAGMVAGAKTKSNKIGYVAPIPIPEIYRLINAFTLGVKAVNKDATVNVVWIGDWFNPAKEMDAAKSMIEIGCDVITQGGDSPAPQQAAETVEGVYSIGHDNDMKEYAPKSILTSAVWHWGVIYKEIAEQVANGTWKSESIWWGIETGVAGITKFSDKVSKKTQKIVKEKEDDIKKGKLKIFEGPLYDQNGNKKVDDGVMMTDQELLSINWFVDGVVGAK